MSTVAKSYYEGSDPVLAYCLGNSHIHPAMESLQKATLNVPRSMMLGAPECLLMNQTFIRSKGATKVLDVGMFTGASALASALAIEKKSGSEAKVVTCDVSDTHLELAKKHWEMAGVADLIHFKLGPASDSLQGLIDAGEAGTYNFAFIDADKGGYVDYYEKCLVLMKKGGVMAFDNTLRGGRVVSGTSENPDEKAIIKVNGILAKDTERVFVVQLNIGDGYTLATKL